MSTRGYHPVPSSPATSKARSHSLADSKLFTAELRGPEPPLRLLAQTILHYLLRPKVFLSLVILSIFFIAAKLTPRGTAAWGALDVGLDPNATWAQLYEASRGGWVAYEPEKKVLEDTGVLPTVGDAFSDECIEGWIARGELCDEMEGRLKEREKVGAIYTYTNGSDLLLRMWRSEVTAMLNGRVRPEVAKLGEFKTQRHFREHDELRFSVRSLLSSFLPDALNQVTLLTTDLPVDTLLHNLVSPATDEEAPEPSSLASTSRVGQVPTWLDDTSLQPSNSPHLKMVHHTSFFDDLGNLPCFNSLAIESQMPNLESETEFALYLNDDTFLLGQDNFAASDVGSPLYGPIFRLQRSFTVDESPPPQARKERRAMMGGPGPGRMGLQRPVRKPATDDPEGEWPSLKHANWLLNRRFGKRARGYLAHIPKTISFPLMREAQQLWHDELSQTASSRFRGRKTEYQPSFLFAHYIIERHREALLWSFFVARADRDRDGSLSWAERRHVLNELGFSVTEGGAEEEVQGVLPLRATLANLPSVFERTGLEPPRSTKIAFDSKDGFAMFNSPALNASSSEWPAHTVIDEEEIVAPRNVCTFKRLECLGAGFDKPAGRISTDTILRQLAFERPECGDCAIAILVSKSGREGLDAFLPLSSSTTSSSSDRPTVVEPLSPTTKDWTKLDYASTVRGHSAAQLRLRAARLIQRYSYAVGDTPSRFYALKQVALVTVALKSVEKNRPAFVTLNDDMLTEGISNRVTRMLATWFHQQWPNPSPYERTS